MIFSLSSKKTGKIEKRANLNAKCVSAVLKRAKPKGTIAESAESLFVTLALKTQKGCRKRTQKSMRYVIVVILKLPIHFCKMF